MMQVGVSLFDLLLLACVSLQPVLGAVSLSPDSGSVCMGVPAVFTCVTDTGRLAWKFTTHSQFYYQPSQVSDPVIVAEGIFNISLTQAVGGEFVSQTIVSSILSDYENRNITCADGTEAMSNSETVTLRPVGPPSPPLNLVFTSSSTLSSVTISWVAPLDTPLCLHSYTVTVRNSCNSSQVMVYNTTDNRSSLSITDLTSDGEYSVTVAGRDGAGRLGQESEVLKINLKAPKVVFHDHTINNEALFVQWTLVQESCFSTAQYLITHNVSSDQSPITTNRTNVTLYGVRPGETYTVEIIPYNVLFRRGEPLLVKISVPGLSTNLSSPYDPLPNTTTTLTSPCTQGHSNPVTVTVYYTPSPLPPQNCPECSGQGIQLWALVAMIVPWVLLLLVVVAVLICYCFSIRKAKKRNISDLPRPENSRFSYTSPCDISPISPAYEIVTGANSVRSQPPPLPRERGGGGPAAPSTVVYEELAAFEGKSLSMKQNQSYSTVMRNETRNGTVNS